MSATVIGALAVQFGGETAAFNKSLKAAEIALGHFGGAVQRAVSASAKFGAAAALAGVAVGIALIKNSSEAIDTQSKLARQLGGTVLALQTVERAADLAGISKDELTSAADRLNHKLGEAMRESMGPTADALKRIGLNAKDLSKLDIDERFAAIADAIKKAGLNAQQTADLFTQLGIRSGKIFSLMEEGGDAIRQARQDVRLFGVAVSDIDAKMIERANDAMTVFGLAAKGVGNQLAVQLAPALEHVAESFRKVVEEAGGIGPFVERGIGVALRAIAYMQKQVYDLRIALDELTDIKFELRVPDWLNHITGWKGEITLFDNTAQSLRKTLEKPPSAEEWEAWWNQIQAKAREVKLSIEGIRDSFYPAEKNKPAALDDTSSKERKQLQDKLATLKEALASEDMALKLHRDKQLADIADFESKGIAKRQEANALRQQAEEKYQKGIQDLVLSRIEEGILTEQELLARKHEQQLVALAEFEKNKTIVGEKAEEYRRKLVEKNELDRLQIQARQWSAAAGIVDTSMSQISALIGSESKKQFGIMKAVASATAAVKGYEAVVSAIAAGNATGIPGAGMILGAITAAGVAAQIAAIHRTNPGSGGGAPSVSGGGGGGGGGGAAAAPAQPAAPKQALYLTLKGQNFSAEQVRELAEKLIDYQYDGGQIVLAGSSLRGGGHIGGSS